MMMLQPQHVTVFCCHRRKLQVSRWRRRNTYHHGSQRTHFDGQQLGADPGDGGDAGREEGDVADDGDEDEDAGPADLARLDDEVLADGDVAEGHGRDDERDAHAHARHEHDDAPPEPVEQRDAHEREDEVGRADDDADRHRLVESDEPEERARVVHERVEASELGHCGLCE